MGNSVENVIPSTEVQCPNNKQKDHTHQNILQAAWSYIDTCNRRQIPWDHLHPRSQVEPACHQHMQQGKQDAGISQTES